MHILPLIAAILCLLAATGAHASVIAEWRWTSPTTNRSFSFTFPIEDGRFSIPVQSTHPPSFDANYPGGPIEPCCNHCEWTADLWVLPQGNGLGVHFIGSVGAVYAWPGIYRTLYGANISFSGEAIFSRYTTFDSDCIYLAPVEAKACNQLVRQIRANRNDVWATRDFGWWTSMNGVHVPDPEGYPVGLRLPPIPLPATGLGLPGALIALAVLVVERRRQGWLRGG